MVKRSEVKTRIRALAGDLYAMGPGKADLLEAIAEIGSISAAGRQLGMSYMKTRKLVEEMNLGFKNPVVEEYKGGAQNGGAQLTVLGSEVLQCYRVMQGHAEAAICADLEGFHQYLRTHPADASSAIENSDGQ